MSKIHIDKLSVGRVTKKAFSIDSDSFLIFPKGMIVDKDTLKILNKLKIHELEDTSSYDLSTKEEAPVEKKKADIVKGRADTEGLYNLYNSNKCYKAYLQVIAKLFELLGPARENEQIDHKTLFDFVQREVVEVCIKYREFYLVVRNFRPDKNHVYLSYAVASLFFYFSLTFYKNSETKILNEMSKTINNGLLILLTLRSLERLSKVLHTSEKPDVSTIFRTLYKLCYMTVKKNEFPNSCIETIRQMVMFLDRAKQKTVFLNHDNFTLHTSALYVLLQTDTLLKTPASTLGAMRYIQEKFSDNKYLASMSRLNHLLSEFPPGTWVQLKNKGIGMIVENNELGIAAPSVILVIDSFKKIQKKFSVISTLSNDFAVDAAIQNRVILSKLETVLGSRLFQD